MIKPFPLFLLVSLFATCNLCVPSFAQVRTKAVVPEEAAPQSQSSRMNDWTVGIAAGLPDGGFVRFASEMARTLEDGDKMRLIPMVTRGTTSNIADLLYLKGVDVAITYADALDSYKKNRDTRNVADKIRYITQFFVSDIHIYAREQFKTIDDLRGQKVAIGTPSVAAALTGPIIFERLGIEITPIPLGGPIALEKLRSGEIAAMVYVAAKPSELFAAMKKEEGLHFLSVPFSEKFDDYYYPSQLTKSDYPTLLTSEPPIETIAVPSLLAAFNWPHNSDRGRRVDRFVDYLFENFDRLKKPPFHPKWKEINLAAPVPSWKRYPYADLVLSRMKAKLDAQPTANAAVISQNSSDDDRKSFESSLAKQGSLPKTAVERDALYRDFLKWKSGQPK